jgi:hypothetical protein
METQNHHEELDGSRNAYEYAPKTKLGERTDGPVTELVEKPELAGHFEGGGEERAPLLYVRGQHWSPGVYRSMRLLGRSVEVAWERAFIALHFLNIISDY